MKTVFLDFYLKDENKIVVLRLVKGASVVKRGTVEKNTYTQIRSIGVLKETK